MQKKYNLEYKITRNNIHIKDSYIVTDLMPMLRVIQDLRDNYNTGTNVLTRSNKDLIAEWRAHNLLYFLHIFPAHTIDVDLDTSPSIKYFMPFFNILSRIYGLILPLYKRYLKRKNFKR